MPILNYITWNVSPWLYEGEHFAIGWYGTLATVLFICYLLDLCWIAKQDGLKLQVALLVFIISMPTVELFGHIVHCLFYEWNYYEESLHILAWNIHWRNAFIEHPIGLLNLAHGGFASHGAYVGAFVSAWILKKIIGFDFFWSLDRLVLCSCVMFITRVGNLMVGEIYGTPTSLPWGFIFEENGPACHPTQIYEIFIFLSAYIVGHYLFAKKDWGRYKGLLAGSIFVYIFTLRILVEFIKNPQGAFEGGWVLNMGQLLSIPFLLYGIYLVVKALKAGMVFRKDEYVIKNNHQARKEAKRAR